MPRFTWSAIISLALPLFVVTMASQNLPGVEAMQAAGYAGTGGAAQAGAAQADHGIPISKIITLTGLATLVLAPFGAFALSLSAITAAICMGKEAHPDPAKRYAAAVTCGAIYVLIGIFWCGHHRRAHLVSQRAGGRHCWYCAARHYRQQSDRRAA